MGLYDLLTSVGGKLGLVRIITAPATTPMTKVQTRTCTLNDLASEVKQEEVKALAELPAELSVAFEKVFEAAGVKPGAHGWTVDRLSDLLASDPFKGLNREQVQKVALERLTTDKAQIEEVVKDAVARDQALDAFEKFVRGKMDKRIEARARQLADVETQLRALEDQRRKLQQETTADEQKWKQWRSRKLEYEKKMIQTVGHFVDSPVVTTDEPEER